MAENSMGCFDEEFVFRAERIMMHQDGHPRLRYALRKPSEPSRYLGPANRIPPSSGSVSFAGSEGKGPALDAYRNELVWHYQGWLPIWREQ